MCVSYISDKERLVGKVIKPKQGNEDPMRGKMLLCLTSAREHAWFVFLQQGCPILLLHLPGSV